MRKIQNDVSIDAIACGFRSGFGEMASISFCLESAVACGFRYSIAEMASISTRGGHVHAFTYDYVKTRPEYPAPHDLSATQSEAPRSECVVIDVAKCGFRSGIGERAGISFCLESAFASGFQSGFGEMASISSRRGHVCAFTYNYVKTRPEHPAPHDLLSSGGNEVCFATTPPDMEASCKASQQSGYATQHLQPAFRSFGAGRYLPFGESWIDQQSGSFNTRYTFSAKELDDETQYSYFGARYYDSDLSVWLSVDPMSDERSWITSYNYCQWNPVGRVDPTGALDWEPIVNEVTKAVSYKAEAGDNRETFMNQYGLSAKQTIDIFDKAGVGVVKAGETQISGETVKSVTGSEILKLDWKSDRATDQRKVDQIMFGVKKSQVENKQSLDLKDFNTNMYNDGVGFNASNVSIRVRNERVKIQNINGATDWSTSLMSFPQPGRQTPEGSMKYAFYSAASLTNPKSTRPLLLLLMQEKASDKFEDYYYNPSNP